MVGVVVCAAVAAGGQPSAGALAIDERQGDQYGWAVGHETASAAQAAALSVLSLKPLVEVGLRHDGGDAETGTGMDLGGGVMVFSPSTGLSVDVRVRMLLVHQAENGL